MMQNLLSRYKVLQSYIGWLRLLQTRPPVAQWGPVLCHFRGAPAQADGEQFL